MVEFLNHLLELPFWSKLADLHGLLAMLSLILFGASLVLYFMADKAEAAFKLLKKTVAMLFIDLLLLDIAGLLVYIPYRAPGGPRSILKGSEATDWLHSVVFEHKEFLAFAPMILVFAAFMVLMSLNGQTFKDKSNKDLKHAVIGALVISLIFVLVVAAEAVLVTKAAPI